MRETFDSFLLHYQEYTLLFLLTDEENTAKSQELAKTTLILHSTRERCYVQIHIIRISKGMLKLAKTEPPQC